MDQNAVKTSLQNLLRPFGYEGIRNRKQKILVSLLLFLLISAIIGYLISPKVFFKPRLYQEGDIILQNQIIEEDLLIPDHVSTRLKREKLIREQRPIFDFDPTVVSKTGQLITDAFQQARTAHEQIASGKQEIEQKNRLLGREFFQSMSRQQELLSDYQFFNRYRSILKNRLETLQKEAKHSLKDFERKRKLDADLNIVNQILVDHENKKKYHQGELQHFEDRFSRIREETTTLTDTLQNRKEKANESFIRDLRIEISENEKSLLDMPYYEEAIETQLRNLLTTFLALKIIASKDIIPNNETKTIDIRNLVTGETVYFDGFEDIHDIR